MLYFFFSAVNTLTVVFLPIVQAPAEEESLEEPVWCDVGVFRTLFSEITEYYLPPKDGEEALPPPYRFTSSKEVYGL